MHYTNAARRTEIASKLKQVLREHELHGEVLVRLLHESEMALVQSVPKFSKSIQSKISVIKCKAKHHKDLLNQICALLDGAAFEVSHASVDTDIKGLETAVFYIQRNDGTGTSADEHDHLKKCINDLYRSNAMEGNVVIAPFHGASIPATPSLAPPSPGQSSEKKFSIGGACGPPVQLASAAKAALMQEAMKSSAVAEDDPYWTEKDPYPVTESNAIA
jgi:hypothetical protein